MEEALTILVVIDGLRADALGAYGNDQAETPFLDRLSGESIVYDLAFCLDPDVESFYASLLFGIHPHARPLGTDVLPQTASGLSLAERCSHYLVTDDPVIAEFDFHGFAWDDAYARHVDEVGQSDTGSCRAFFRSAAEWLGQRLSGPAGQPRVGWIHTAVCSGGTVIESRQEYDFRISQIDESIGELFASLPVASAKDILLIVTGARGYAMGERGEIGTNNPVLHEELLHVPLIVYCNRQNRSPHRALGLTSPMELAEFVSARVGADASALPAEANPAGSSVASRYSAEANTAECLFFVNPLGDQAIRTPGWYLIRKSLSAHDPGVAQIGSERHQLFLKPDDRWEYNEVSSRRPEIVEELESRLDALARLARAGEPLRLPSLPPELLKGF